MNVAIVGCGGIGREYHAPAWSKVDGIRIVAACDVDFAKAEQLAAAYPGCKAYKSVPEMLDKQRDLDVTDVTTTERHRVEPLIQCLEAGKHCFCEKPLAGRNGQYDVREVDLQDSKRVIDAWKKSGKKFGISFNYRFAPHAIQMKRVIDSGEAGTCVLINVFARLECWSHVIDLMRWFNGDVDEMSAYVTGKSDELERVAALRFANGSLGSLVGTRSIGWNHDLLRIEWVGTKERLVISDLSGRFDRFPNDASSGVTVWHKPHGDYRHEFGATLGYSVQAFARALLAGQDPPITGIDAIREIEIDAAFTMSAERGRPVKIEHYG